MQPGFLAPLAKILSAISHQRRPRPADRYLQFCVLTLCRVQKDNFRESPMKPRPPFDSETRPAFLSREVVLTGTELGFPELESLTATKDFLSSRVGWHEHPFWEVLFIFRGGASYEFEDGRIREVQGDHFLVIPPGARHRGVEEIRLPSELLSVGVANPGTCANRSHSPLSSLEGEKMMQGLVSAAFGVFKMHSPMLEEADQLRRLVLDQGENGSSHSARLRHMTALLLVGLTEDICSGESAQLSEPVSAALNFLQTHIAQPVGMDAVAAEVGLSRKQFYLRFRREMGMTPNDYLQRLRLRAAEKLLATTDWTVETVGAEAGFPRAPYFCRVFRNYFGRTPGQYREEWNAKRVDSTG